MIIDKEKLDSAIDKKILFVKETLQGYDIYIENHKKIVITGWDDGSVDIGVEDL